jgi:hypothetical protein
MIVDRCLNSAADTSENACRLLPLSTNKLNKMNLLRGEAQEFIPYHSTSAGDALAR